LVAIGLRLGGVSPSADNITRFPDGRYESTGSRGIARLG
jgi:hypothetical protein